MQESDGPKHRMGYALLGLGIALRVCEYLHNKALWLDEAHLVLSILRRNYAGLLERLDYGQGAPLGFLWAERFVANLVGDSEYALRFVPLLASIAACVVCYLVFKRHLKRESFLVVFAVFALSQSIIRYASEAKAYSTDLLVGVALWMLFLSFERERMSQARFLIAALAGAAAVWFAFPAIFILGGVGAVFVAHAARRRDAKSALMWISIIAVWGGSFAVDYILLLRFNTGNAEVRTWWLDRFMPLPPTSLSEVNWFVRTFMEVFSEPVGLGAGGLGALLYVLGVIALQRRDRLRLALLTAPIGVTLLASGLQQYPFMGRFVLFAVPMILMVMGEGWSYFRARVPNRIVAAAFLAVLFVQPSIAAARGVIKPGAEGVRPAFEQLMREWREGDHLYVYAWAVAPFQYYEFKHDRDFPEVAGVSSRADWNYYVDELNALRGNGRVWVVFINTPSPLVGEECKFFRFHLDSIGRRVQSNEYRESSLMLYDLTQAQTGE